MNRVTIAARSIGRALGVNRWLRSALGSKRYEERFSNALLGTVREGDVVWDVGANVGYYSLPLAERVGATGRVVAIEPNPACVERIRRQQAERGQTNLLIIEAALANESGTMPMSVSDDEASTTNRLLDGRDPSGRVRMVEVVTGDLLIARGDAPSPNIVKIDVEGFELECIDGLVETLRNPTLRAVFLEIHFSELESRGNKYAPVTIETRLREAGFTRLTWLDASHLGATRNES